MKLLLILFVLGSTSAFHTGAPGELACGSMTPQHGFDPQTSGSPYRILMTSTKSSGEPLEITLTAPTSGPKFRGFFIQIRPVGKSQPVGQFKPDSDKQAQPVTCNTQANAAMTHKDNNDKDQVKLMWTPPTGDGEYDVFVTFVKQQDTFWVKQMRDGDKITVTSSTGRMSDGGGQGQQPSNPSSANTNTNSKPNNGSQPPSEAGVAQVIPFWGVVSLTIATVLISFVRYTHFRHL